jgi:HlyD family secretion protein
VNGNKDASASDAAAEEFVEDIVKKLLRTVIILAVAASITTGAYLHFRPTQVSAAAAVSTATVARGTLAATVTAAGNIQASQTADLSFGQTGTVKQINVAVGDEVTAGQVLAELDTADLELQVRSAQVALKNAQDTLAKAKNPNTTQDIASARATVESAQAAYDKVAAGASQADLASAGAAVTGAQAAYDAAVKSAGTSDSSLQTAAATLQKALIAVQQAQSAYDKVSWRGDVAATTEASALQSATIDFDSAKAAYEALAATSKSDAASKVASAAAALQSAQAGLAGLKNQVTAADLAAAKATLTQAQNDLDTLLAGSDTNTLDIAQNGVEAAQIALDQARLKLQQAQVVAPFDGVITAIDVKLGQSASGTAFTIADLDHLEIVVNMAETDVNQIKVGQQAEMTLDAVSDTTFNGAVSAIAPAGTQSSGVVSYPVTVALTNTSDAVKTGMTTNLNIIVEQRDDVLTVPNKAVKTVNKQKVVTVLSDGKQVQTPVQVGLSNDTSTEITGGLTEGDVVVLGATTTTASVSGGGPGMGIPGVG